MSEVESFDVLEVKTATVAYAGEVLEIKALPIGRFPAFVRHIRLVYSALAQIDMAIERGEDVTERAIDLIAEHGETLQLAVQAATGKPLDFIQSGGLDEFFDLLKAVMEVNRDFFARPSNRTAPKSPEKAEKKSPGRGRKASSS